MGRFINNQDSFTAGEISELLHGRPSLDQYKDGLAECLNAFPMKGGGFQRRNGSKFHFSPSHDLAHIGEYGPTELITDIKIIPYKLSGDEQYIVAVLKLQTKIRIQFYKAQAFTGLAYSHGSNSSVLSTDYLPYNTDIQKIQYTQSGTLMVLTFESRVVPPLFISLRDTTGAPLWYLNFASYVAPSSGALTFAGNNNLSNNVSGPSLSTKNHNLSGHFSEMSQPFRDLNSTQITMTAGAVSGNTTVTSSQAYFSLGIVGSWLKLTAATTGVMLITEYISPTVVNVTIHINTPVTATKLWEISAWNSKWGFPAVSSFFEQRLILGSTIDQPDTFWGSQTANLSMFMEKKLAQDLATDGSGANYFGPAVDSDPFAFQIASNEINKIEWLMATRTLYAGSVGAEFSISGANSALSKTSFSINPESNIGSSYVQPIAVDNSVIHISRDGKHLRQLKYSFNNGSVISKDLTILGERIESSLITNFVTALFTSLALDKSKGMIYALVNNSTESCILSILVDETVNVLGWSKHQLAGANKVLSICTIQNLDNLKEQLYIATKRTILGVDVFSVEIISNAFEGASLVDYLGTIGSLDTTNYNFMPTYVDCAKIYDGAPVTVFNHPVLKSVAVVGLRDGIYFTGALDASGNITLPSSSKVVFGLAFTSRMKLLPPNLGAFGNNDALPSKKRLDKIWVRYLRAKHLLFGTSSSNLLDLEIDTSLVTTTLNSDIKSKALQGISEFAPQIIIETDKPFPAIILQVGYRGVTEEI